MGLLADPVGSVCRVAQIRCDLRGRGAWLTGGVDPPELRGGRSAQIPLVFFGGFLSFVTWWIFSGGFEFCDMVNWKRRRRDGGKRRRSQRVGRKCWVGSAVGDGGGGCRRSPCLAG
ncbi:hypothetical protein Fot_17457 [Forsythia ovata]|uniref:Uncharacterized protein n=1 Tax=Forsythia ovata TaxID=205694 RepID=A0ABD1VFE5_9LAMI